MSEARVQATPRATDAALVGAAPLAVGVGLLLTVAAAGCVVFGLLLLAADALVAGSLVLAAALAFIALGANLLILAAIHERLGQAGPPVRGGA